MTKIIFLNIFLCLVNYSTCQKFVNNIEVTDSSLTFGNVTAYRMYRGGIIGIDKLKKAAPGEKMKKYWDKELKSWLYFFCNSGIEIDCAERGYDVMAIHILYRKRSMDPNFWISRRMRKYTGKLVIDGVEISPETTLGSLKNIDRIKCCCKINANEVIVELGNLHCSILFEDINDASKVINVIID